MPITSHLIIYRKSTYQNQEDFLIAHNVGIDYFECQRKDNETSRFNQYRLLRGCSRHTISKLKCIGIDKEPHNTHLLSLIKRIKVARHIELENYDALICHSDILAFRKLCTYLKHSHSLAVTERKDSVICLKKLKQLVKLRNLHNFDFSLSSCADSKCQGFENLITIGSKKTSWPKVERFIFRTEFTYVTDRDFYFDHIYDNYSEYEDFEEHDSHRALVAFTRNLVRTVKDEKLRPVLLDLHLVAEAQIDHEHAAILVKAIRKLPNLRRFEYEEPSDEHSDFSRLIKAINDKENLKEVVVYEDSAKCDEEDRSLTTLTNALESFSDLRRLSVTINEQEDVGKIKEFAKNLKCLKALQKLKVNFNNQEIIDDETYRLLGESLTYMKELKSLSIIIDMNGNNEKSLDKGLDFLSGSLSSLTKLMEIEIYISNSILTAKNIWWRNLCLSLKKMTNLRSLNLSIQNCNLGDEDLYHFTNIMPKLTNLEALSFSFDDSNISLSTQILNILIASASEFKYLQDFGLISRCSEVKEDLLLSLQMMIPDFKSLKRLEIHLNTVEEVDPAVRVLSHEVEETIRRKRIEGGILISKKH